MPSRTPAGLDSGPRLIEVDRCSSPVCHGMRYRSVRAAPCIHPGLLRRFRVPFQRINERASPVRLNANDAS
jgi:hypothetical protein